MNILIVSSYLPYPLFSGGHVRLYNLLKLLGKRHTVTLVCEKRTHQTQDDIDAVRKLCKDIIVVDRKKQWTLENIVKTGFSSYPFLIIGHTNQDLQKAIQKKLSQDSFDLIHIETSYVFQNLLQTHIPTVLVEHNIEYMVYDRFVKRAPIFLQPLLAIDVAKLERTEKMFWKKATKVVVVSEKEKQYIPRKDVAIVPNGVDTSIFTFLNSEKKIKKAQKTILFIGDFTWIQNRDAASFILKEVWPIIKIKNQSFDSAQDRHSKFKIILWIVGKHIPESIKNITSDQDIVFDENAPEKTPEIFARADILLSPVRIGGGTSYKILEAMASGVPVITTQLGVEGIDAKNNKEIILANNPASLANGINVLLSNEDLYKTIAKNARLLVETKYDWKSISDKLESVYTSVV